MKLLNATTDRTKTPHHFIDLLTNTSAQFSGNVLTYTLQPVSTEEAGTYTVALRAVKRGTPPVNQIFVLADFQLGTATVEKQIVAKEKCAACHLGTSNAQFYLHHVDPSGTNAYGSPVIDAVPIGTCKACHNNEGYAAAERPVEPDQDGNLQAVPWRRQGFLSGQGAQHLESLQAAVSERAGITGRTQRETK